MIVGAFVGTNYSLKTPFYISTDWNKAKTGLYNVLRESNKLGSISFDDLKLGFINLSKDNKITIVNPSRALKLAVTDGQICMTNSVTELNDKMIDLTSYSKISSDFMRRHINDF